MTKSRLHFSVNPLHTGELISTFPRTSSTIRKYCVNPLHLGELISTDKICTGCGNSERCQSPSPRGTHFYCTTRIIPTPVLRTSVNPLHLGELISSVYQVGKVSADLIGCQSPSPRGTHFYEIIMKLIVAKGNVCQSPSPRGTHFYLPMSIFRKHMQEMCQSPSPRGTHFYSSKMALPSLSHGGVNPLHTGELISTWRRSNPWG